MTTKMVIKRVFPGESGCYCAEIYDNHSRFCFTLPDSNWYTTKQMKDMIALSGITCIDLTQLTDREKEAMVI